MAGLRRGLDPLLERVDAKVEVVEEPWVDRAANVKAAKESMGSAVVSEVCRAFDILQLRVSEPSGQGPFVELCDGLQAD